MPTSRPERVDAVVIGSGFGGSAAAARLAEAGFSVVILERGKLYPPGSFPRSPHTMARNWWDPSEGLFGLFEAWTFRTLGALVSSGVGGGSLIYANVLLRKDEKWFVTNSPDGEDWPEDMAITRENAVNVRKALGELPNDQKHAIELAFFDGLTHVEISDKLAVPLGTIKTRTRAGMIKMREVLMSRLADFS